MSKGGSFLEGWLFRPQGEPMHYPYTIAAKFSQFPYKHYWRESFMFRYMGYALIAWFPFCLMIHKKVNSPANTAFWREKRKHDAEHHAHEMAKKWETRT